MHCISYYKKQKEFLKYRKADQEEVDEVKDLNFIASNYTNLYSIDTEDHYHIYERNLFYIFWLWKNNLIASLRCIN